MKLKTEELLMIRRLLMNDLQRNANAEKKELLDRINQEIDKRGNLLEKVVEWCPESKRTK